MAFDPMPNIAKHVRDAQVVFGKRRGVDANPVKRSITFVPVFFNEVRPSNQSRNFGVNRQKRFGHIVGV